MRSSRPRRDDAPPRATSCVRSTGRVRAIGGNVNTTMRTLGRVPLRMSVAVVTALLLSGEGSSVRAPSSNTESYSGTDSKCDADVCTDDTAGRRVEDAHGDLRLHDARLGV